MTTVYTLPFGPSQELVLWLIFDTVLTILISFLVGAMTCASALAVFSPKIKETPSSKKNITNGV